MIPPLASQFLNLTKNSSLGVAISFVEIASIFQRVSNNATPALQALVILMFFYLTLSLGISLIANVINRRLSLETRDMSDFGLPQAPEDPLCVAPPPPPIASGGLREILRDNLFKDLKNSVLTLLFGAVLGYIALPLAPLPVRHGSLGGDLRRPADLLHGRQGLRSHRDLLRDAVGRDLRGPASRWASPRGSASRSRRPRDELQRARRDDRRPAVRCRVHPLDDPHDHPHDPHGAWRSGSSCWDRRPGAG